MRGDEGRKRGGREKGKEEGEKKKKICALSFQV
jgi:hypothetical protein